LPAWVALAQKVLRFSGYFEEAVLESTVERKRVRKVHVYYYLEDDSLQVSEPRVDNSGLQQGLLVKRHRIPHPNPRDPVRLASPPGPITPPPRAPVGRQRGTAANSQMSVGAT
jgi:hypothetical protein